MPLYEYHCESCGHRFELIRKFSDPPLEVCPECGKSPVTKLVSAPGIQFKGSGWYITDYAGGSSSAAGSDKSAPKSSPASSAPASSTPAPTTSTTSDSKPAAKPESK